MRVDVVVTRHAGLVEYLRAEKIIGTDVPVLPHASAEDVRGKHVVGVLPLRLAVECERVVEIPLDLPAELRGVELTADQVRQYAGPPVEYSACRVDQVAPADLDAMETSRGTLRAEREALVKLASDPDVGVRRGVAEHPSTPPGVLAELASDPG